MNFGSDGMDFRDLIEMILKNNETETRCSVGQISSICDILADQDKAVTPEEYRECLNNVMISCCRLMKITELTSRVAKVLFYSEANFDVYDLNSYLKEFATKCNETLGALCKVNYVPPPEGCFPFETCMDYLEYLLLVCVRKAVLDDAHVFEMRMEIRNQREVTIIMEAPDSYPELDRPPLFKISTDDLMAVNSTLAGKINGYFKCEGKVMKLKLINDRPIRPVFKSPELSYPTKTFTSYHNLLADLGGYKFYE